MDLQDNFLIHIIKINQMIILKLVKIIRIIMIVMIQVILLYKNLFLLIGVKKVVKK